MFLCGSHHCGTAAILDGRLAKAPSSIGIGRHSIYAGLRLMKLKIQGPQLRARIRIECGEDIALGPGKVDLLALIAETGSIRVAAERMNMSYMRAWTLIRTMNRCFKKPVVEAVRGGKRGGGARLTETGRRALALYQGMERTFLQATSADWSETKKLLRT